VSAGIEPITTAEAAFPAAHYSQCVRAGEYIWTSGTVGTDPRTGAVVEGFEAQVHQAIANVRAALRAADSDLDQVIKTNCFVTNRSDFLKLDPIYRDYFPTPPGRTTIVCDLVFEELLFEIEAVALVAR